MTPLEKRTISAFAKAAMKDEKELTLETKFEEIGTDSSDFICMIFELETEFDIEIPQDFENNEFVSLGDVAEAVQKYVTDNNIDISKAGTA